MAKRKRTKRGGVIVTGVASHTFPSYRACHSKDCVPSTFYELGMYAGTSVQDSQYDFIARCFPNGMSEKEVIAILDEAYQIPHYSQVYTKDTLPDLSLRLVNNEALLAGIDTHQFIVLKENNQLFVRESRYNQVIPIDAYLDEMATHGIYHFSVIFTERGDRIPLRSEARITPYVIRKLASEGKLPSYRYVPNPNTTWALASTLRGGTRKRR